MILLNDSELSLVAQYVLVLFTNTQPMTFDLDFDNRLADRVELVVIYLLEILGLIDEENRLASEF
jgi:hypothetical protein